MKGALAGMLVAASIATSAHAVEQGYAPVNGLRMYYEVHGAGDGKTPPLVLLHGGGSTIEITFERFLSELAKRRQVIAFEQQGHGRTNDIADRPFTFEQSADDAAALLRHLKVERADFFGFSNGGSIAMQIAIRHPKLVRRLVVASAMYKRDGLFPGFFDMMKGATLEQMPAEFREAYLRLAPQPERLQSFHDKCVRRMLDFRDWPADALRSIDAPVLVMAGDADVIRPEHAVEMYRLFRHGRLAILPNTDHMAFTVKTENATRMIEEFLTAATP